MAERFCDVIRSDAAWFAPAPLDMRAGVDTALLRVVSVFGESRVHYAYLFMNKRANRMKVMVHDGFGLWLCERRPHQWRFVSTCLVQGERMPITWDQLQALIVGPPWERLEECGSIRVL